MLENIAVGQKFPFGEILLTRGAAEAINHNPQQLVTMLQRHGSGDWGDVCAEDKQENDLSLKNGFRLLSVYHTDRGVKLWLITEWDRSVSTFLLPEEY